jgi:transcription antitermination protein NusB
MELERRARRAITSASWRLHGTSRVAFSAGPGLAYDTVWGERIIMPVLRRNHDESGYYAQASARDEETIYILSVEGQRFLTDVLGVRAGCEFSARDLAFLLDRGWAKLQEPEPEVIAPAPVTPAVPKPSIPESVEVEASPRSRKPSGQGKPPVNRRSRAREVALQILYLLEQNPGVDPAEIARFIERRLRDEKLREFAESLVEGVRAHQPRIDTLISDVAENWRLDRMAAIDRNILRLGAFEMLFCPDVPTKVAINEALELAKRYSTAQSSRFVNGILDRLQGADTAESPIPSDASEPPAEEAPPPNADGPSPATEPDAEEG